MKLYTAFIFSFLFTGCILSTQGWMPTRFSEKVRDILQCIRGTHDFRFRCDDSIFKNVNKMDCEELAAFIAEVAADEQVKDGLKQELGYCKKTSTSNTKPTSYIKGKCNKLNSICSLKNGNVECKIENYIYYLLENKNFY